MREAVIVSYARTPIGRAFKGAFNRTLSPSLTAHAISHAVSRASVAPDEIDDVVVGCVLTAGTAGLNLARQALLAAGLPVTVPGQTIDRQCASGLMAIATAAHQVVHEGMNAVVAAGQDNISAVQNDYFAAVRAAQDPAVTARAEHAYMPMLETAEHVARRYDISREAQDAYALESQRRTAAAQASGRFDAEIVPMRTQMAVHRPRGTRDGAARGEPREGRGQSAGHDGAVPRRAEARDPRRLDHRGQREPALRRRGRLRRGRAQAMPRRGTCRCSGSIAAWRWRAARRRRWGSARSTPCRSCSRATA